ncbi:50S ribosomal protein L11 methyltransferase [Tumebacillus permanentifrigoris]|uniref:Ribosomal protein L11 methyltransferase n=1 Tax=Tumebacillus permanentifrigoris TaxID=378543 RepID=A0A316D7D4_9BACL|nr:50S ribosomal protein L11 methyltransferase [Tumebacillus permanentifrigoris]PWK08394.1 [LSU ribosomal protein L11P]-lysine N-methyltransferase [Tumebacillus permanentifrigoris]
MQWAEVQVLTTEEAVEAVSAIFERFGANGVVLEDSNDLTRTWEDRYGEIYGLNPADFPESGVRVKAYVAVEIWQEAMKEQIAAEIRGLQELGIDPGHVNVEVRIADEEEWANEWKKYYHPVQVTDRLTIKPTWEEYTPREGEVLIELDPGMAFGTGTHPTTNLCIRVLDKIIQPGDTLVDVGCGTGILSIACAKLGAGQVLALDLDPVAVQVAQENVELNQVSEQITVRANDLLKGVDEKFDIVVANILAEIILLMVASARDVLKPQGTFITSGIIKEKADLVRTELEAQGFRIVDKHTEDDWVAFVAKLA